MYFLITLISCKWLLLLLYCHCSLQGWPLHRDIQRPLLSLHFSLLSFDPLWGFPAGSVVKNPPANAGDAGSVPRLGRSPEEEMATHSCILAGKSQGQRNLEGHSPWGHKESDVTEQLSNCAYTQALILCTRTHKILFPLQFKDTTCSCFLPLGHFFCDNLFWLFPLPKKLR